MRTPAPALMPIFRSSLQGELLGATLLEPESEQSLSDLAHRLGASVATIQREVTRLEQAGVLATRKIGNTRLVRADRSSPSFGPLSELVLQSFGPRQVIAEEFARVRGVEDVLIFGSWAARLSGKAGRAPSDIDVLVIGTPDRDEVHEAARRAENRLNKQVNATVRSRASWQSGRDGFLAHVRTQPTILVWQRTRKRTSK